MNAVKFLDTNILVYAYDLDAPAKRDVALRFVAAGWDRPGETAVSVQVLQELYVNLLRKGVPGEQAAQVLRDLSHWPVVENTVALLYAAVAEQRQWGVSFWDALILAAAPASGATELITEDLNSGQDYRGIQAINPFA